MTPAERLLDALARHARDMTQDGGLAVGRAYADWRASLPSAAPAEQPAPRPEWVRALPCGCHSWFTQGRSYLVQEWYNGTPWVIDNDGERTSMRLWERGEPPAPAQPEPTPDALRRAWEAGALAMRALAVRAVIDADLRCEGSHGACDRIAALQPPPRPSTEPSA